MRAQVGKISQGGQLIVVVVEVGFAECFSRLKLAASVELVELVYGVAGFVDGVSGLVDVVFGLVDGEAGLVDELTGLVDELTGWVEYFVEPVVAVDNLLKFLV